MCLIAMCIDKKPSWDVMAKAWATNNDGGGIIWINKDRKAEYIKGINNLTEFYNIMLATELPFVLHFRLASVGGTNDLLTQPFEISKESPLRLHGICDKVLVHNGTEPDWKKCLAAAGLKLPLEPDGKTCQPISDSRAIAMILSRHKSFDFLHSVIGKFVVVGYTNEKDEYAFRYFDSFDEEDGIFYSNLKWKWNQNYYFHQNNVNIAQDTKKKIETESPSLLLNEEEENVNKPFCCFSRKDRARYFSWWKFKAPISSLPDKSAFNRSTFF